MIAQRGADADLLAKLGRTYSDRNDDAEAEAAYTKALALQPDKVDVLVWRSITYSHRQQYDAAMADLNHAVEVSPKDDEAHMWRAENELYLGAFDRAMDDMKVVFVDRPDNIFYRFRGVASYLRGDFGQAESDFLRDIRHDRGFAYLTVWRFFAEQRAGGGDSAALASAADGLHGLWPAPLLKFALGQATADEVLAATASPHPKLQRVRESQAHCIIGEALMINGDRDAAKAHFLASAAIGSIADAEEVYAHRATATPDTIVEFIVARQRLRELGP